MSSGERLRRARELHRLTQVTLVERVPELTQPRLSRAESDKARLDASSLAAIAASTGVTVEWFERGALPGLSELSPHFRARSRTTETTKASGLAWAEVVNEAYTTLLSQAREIPVQLSATSTADPRQAAWSTRHELGFSPLAPLPYLVLAAERVGVRILGLPWRSETVDAFCAWANGVPTVAVAAGVPGDRLRWSVAHELGHLVLHRDGRQGKDVEREADTFAAELLTPIDAMRLELPRHPTLGGLAMLKTRWGVSVKSLVRRARELGYVDEERATGLFRQISARGWNKADPGFVPREKPRAFRKLVEIVVGHDVDRFAASAGWSTELAEAVLSEHARADELPMEASSGFNSGNVIALRPRARRA